MSIVRLVMLYIARAAGQASKSVCGAAMPMTSMAKSRLPRNMLRMSMSHLTGLTPHSMRPSHYWNRHIRPRSNRRKWSFKRMTHLMIRLLQRLIMIHRRGRNGYGGIDRKRGGEGKSGSERGDTGG